MPLLGDIVGLIAASFLMVKAGGYAVQSLDKLSKTYHVGSYVVSFFLIGLVSAFPEGFVSIVAALKGVPMLGFGTLLGSAITDLSLVLGIAAVAAGRIKLTKGLRHELWLLGLLMMPILLALDEELSRLDGIILLGSAVLFFANTVIENHVVSSIRKISGNHVAKPIAMFLVSSAVVFFSAHLAVDFSISLAQELNFPILLIGLLLVSLGTSLPEFVFAFSAVRKHLGDIAVGELVGVVVIDAVVLLGLVAIITPISVVGIDIAMLGVFLATTIALAMYFVRSDKVFTRNEGLVLILFYIVFVIAQVTALA
jgi:cation:H+ antiporter